MFSPADEIEGEYWGQYSKLFSMHNMIFAEQRHKLTNQFSAKFKADLELTTIPKCFDSCVEDLSTGLSSNEKNCLRECYFKKITSRDDMAVYMHLQMVSEKAEALKDIVV